MWLFTKYGFFSVTNARKDKGRAGAPTDPDRLQVRARSRKHLELLVERFAALSGPDISDIIETPKADYLFRLIVPRGVWAEVAGALAMEIAYPNFKNECVKREELEDEYISTLHEVWGAANDLQGRLHGRGAYVWPNRDDGEDEDILPEDYYPPGWLEGDFPDEDPDASSEPKETADAQ